MAYDSPATISRKGKQKPWSHPDRKWEVRDAMHTLMRAEEIKADEKLMAAVQKCAAEEAEKAKDVSRQAARLAKFGRISPAQMEKLAKRG